jgi:alkyl hydroperoxide reductase subunit AhpF
VTQKNAKLSRRNFLLTVGAGGAATAAAVVSGRKATPGAATAEAPDGKRGYQETAHVNNYYRTAMV